MDVLSDVIAVMRTGRPRSARVEWYAPWGQRFPSAHGSAGFQVILKGSCWPIPPDDGEAIALGVARQRLPRPCHPPCQGWRTGSVR
ncbi:cupin domain-containing protein [Nonomuraea sp. NPDC003214]